MLRETNWKVSIGEELDSEDWNLSHQEGERF